MKIIKSEEQREKRINRTSEKCGTPLSTPNTHKRNAIRRGQERSRKIFKEIILKNFQIYEN